MIFLLLDLDISSGRRSFAAVVIGTVAPESLGDEDAVTEAVPAAAAAVSGERNILPIEKYLTADLSIFTVASLR